MEYYKTTTPNIDQFAKQGMVFRNAIAPSSWTLPSHASMFTGKNPSQLSADWWIPLDETYPTLAEAFRDVGYLTSGFIVNYTYCSYEHGLNRGFQHYEDYRKSFEQTLLSSSVIKQLAFTPKFYENYASHNNFGRKSAGQLKCDFLKWLYQQDAGAGFFAFLNYLDAHEPYLPPEVYIPQYAPSRPEGFVYQDNAEKVDKKTILELQDAYDGALRYIDDQIGLLFAELKKEGDESPDKPARGLTMFLIPTKTPGVSYNMIEKLGSHILSSFEVVYEDVKVHKSQILGARGKGWYQLVGTLNNERIVCAAITLGLAKAALDDAAQYAKEREAFGNPIGAFQAIQHPLAEVASELEAARLVTYKAAWMQARDPQNIQTGVICTMAKYLASEVAFRAADRGMRVLAGYGFTEEYDTQRYYRNCRQLIFAPITNEMSKNFIGQVLLGLPKSY